MRPDAHRYRRRVVGWGVLLLALPLAVLAATHSPNEYKDAFGISAVDCDGPFKTFMLAAPALLIYGFGFVASIFHRRNRWSVAVAAICLAICLWIGGNSYRALIEADRQWVACQSD